MYRDGVVCGSLYGCSVVVFRYHASYTAGSSHIPFNSEDSNRRIRGAAWPRGRVVTTLAMRSAVRGFKSRFGLFVFFFLLINLFFLFFFLCAWQRRWLCPGADAKRLSLGCCGALARVYQFQIEFYRK